ncbi:MAG UNVERIFIED_CONTAM: hypothetical protein LVR29_22655 [Microcystis novacekii LVE1205-3]|jgi:hypothetical protein
MNLEFVISHLPENTAYLDTENPSDWIAIVGNSQEIEVTFTAIDKCIEIKENSMVVVWINAVMEC